MRTLPMVKSPERFCSGVRRGSRSLVQAPMQEVQGGGGVGAGAHGPQHVFQVGGVDIVVHGHEVAEHAAGRLPMPLAVMRACLAWPA